MSTESSIFQDAVKTRDTITLQQRRDIKRLYADWADEIADRARHYHNLSTSSAVLSERLFRDLESMLIEASERVSNNVEGIITINMRTMSETVVSSNTKWLTSLGFDTVVIHASMSLIPNAVVQRLVTGQLYESGWSLSKSIWTDNQATQKQIYEIVAGGMAQNKSIYEMSKDLERWVNPDKMRPWNLRNAAGRKIYPREVDYNSQRLARTLVQHSYQQSFVEATKDNDLVECYRWESNGSRACPICIDRDGKHFPKDDLPLDHPNGMCVWVPVLVKDWKQRLAEMLA